MLTGSHDQRGFGRNLLGNLNRLTRQNNEASDVLLLICQVMFQHLQVVQCTTGLAAQRRSFWRVQLGDLLHRGGGAFAILNLPVGIAVQILAALLERLRVTINGFDLLQIGIAGYQHAVIDRQG
ncbi:hypothetical protein D3C75_780970 [compost metagenome]